MGPFRLTYWRDPDGDVPYIKIFGKRIYYISDRNRRQKHYRLRKFMGRGRIKRTLRRELKPLLGYRPDLDDPKSFNEKINWLKLNCHDPQVTRCCDKYSVKSYVAEKIGAEYTVPVLGVWNSAEEIDFDSLPDRFVLKVNWSSGFNIIVRDKAKLDTDSIRQQISMWMSPSQNSYYDMFNWGYKDMKPVVYAEKYIEQTGGQLYDYKLYYSRGEFIYMFIATDRLDKEKSLTYTFYDADLKALPFTYGHKPNADPIPEMPKNIEKMKELGRILAGDFPFVRVDFYETDDDSVYVGEMTFYSGGGTLPFEPRRWDYVLGEKISIS